MTLFEYLAIGFSLVLSFSAMRLVGGLPDALHRERRYWVHAAAIGILLVMTVALFWLYWSYRDVEWSLPKFVLALGAPGALYFLAATLVPENSSDVVSWREHYYAVRFRYFMGLMLMSVLGATTATVFARPYALH